MTVRETRSKHGDASDGAGAGTALGARLSRFDGPAKIRGAALYALEYRPENLVHAVIVQSTIAAGRVRTIDATAAQAAPGVLLVLTPDNALHLNSATHWLGTPPPDDPYLPLAREVTFSGQHVAAVVAETFEQATAAAALVTITYDEAPAVADLDDPRAGDGNPIDMMTMAWGDADAALAAAPVRIEQEYRTPREYNVPIEPHGLIAQWHEDALTIWEPSQWIDGMARTYAEWFGIPFDKVRLVSGAWRDRGDGGKDGRTPGQARGHESTDLHRLWRPARNAADDRARRHAQGQASLDRSPWCQRDLDRWRCRRAPGLGHLDHVCHA